MCWWCSICTSKTVPLLDHATALCRRNQGRLTIVTVLDDLSRSTGVTSVWLKDLQTQLTEGQKTELNTVREAIQHQGIRADAAVLCGTPFLEIIRQVLRADHDLVMTAGEPSSAIGSFFLDSTIMNLMRKCPCPVWVIKPSQTDGFQTHSRSRRSKSLRFGSRGAESQDPGSGDLPCPLEPQSTAHHPCVVDGGGITDALEQHQSVLCGDGRDDE